MKKILLTIIFGLIILAPVSVLAAPTGIGSALGNLGKVNENTGLSSDISVSLGTVINTALSLVGTIFLGLMIYAGILWMTAQGNDDKVQKAKDIIIAAIIGLAVTMSAYAITYFVTNRLTGGESSRSSPLASPPPTQPPSPDAPRWKCCEYEDSSQDDIWTQAACSEGYIEDTGAETEADCAT